MREIKTPMTYIKLFVDYLDAIEPLGDAERGRLFTALLEYGRTGTSQGLCGNERYIFPMMRAQIDRDNEAYSELSATRSAARKNKRNQNEHLITSVQFDNNCTQDEEKDKDEEKEKDEDKEEDESICTRTRTRAERAGFVSPSVEEVREYCLERGNMVDPEYFVDYYTACGWMIGKTPMQDWKAAVRRWERNGISDEKPKEQSVESSSYDADAFFEAAVHRSMERHGKRAHDPVQG